MTREESESIVVTVTCGSCGMKLQAPASGEGRTIKCTRCGAKLRVQLPSAPVPAATDLSAPDPSVPVPPSPPGAESPPVAESSVRPALSPAVPEIPPPPQWQLASESTPTAGPERLPTPADDETGVEISGPAMFQTLPPSPGTAAAEPEELAAWADIRNSPAAATSTPAPALDPGPSVIERAVPQSTFTDAAIADEAVPATDAAASASPLNAQSAPDAVDAAPQTPVRDKPAGARRAPDPIDVSRADAALLLMGVDRSNPPAEAATTTAASKAAGQTTAPNSAVADEPAPGARPHFRRESSSPALPEPIPAMAVLAGQPKAPYLPAATLPPAAQRENRAAEDRAGDGAAAGMSHRSAGEDESSQRESALAAWFRAIVLTGAMVIIGAIAWAAAERIGGIRNWWVVKFACIAWLIGMGTATAMINSRRTGAGAKLFSILAASLAIVLGKALILCLPQIPAALMSFDDPQRWARTFANLAFIPVDPLFFAMAITGSAVRFILSKRDEPADQT